MSTTNKPDPTSPTPSSSTVSLIPSHQKRAQDTGAATGQKDYAAAFGQLSSTYGYGSPTPQTTIPTSYQRSPGSVSNTTSPQASTDDSKSRAERKSLSSRLLKSLSRSSSKQAKAAHRAQSSDSAVEASGSAGGSATSATAAAAPSSSGDQMVDNGVKGTAKQDEAATRKSS